MILNLICFQIVISFILLSEYILDLIKLKLRLNNNCPLQVRIE